MKRAALGIPDTNNNLVPDVPVKKVNVGVKLFNEQIFNLYGANESLDRRLQCSVSQPYFIK